MTGFSTREILSETPTRHPAAVVSVELDSPLRRLEVGEARWAYVVVRRSHRVLGHVLCPVVNRGCNPGDLALAISRRLARAILVDALAERLRGPLRAESLRLADLYAPAPSPALRSRPSVSVAVCTRDRPEQLACCLASLARLEYRELEVLVVDNAPSSGRTRQLVEAEYPQFRYVEEPRPGLDNARNRALDEARGELLAFTDDDVVVDARWIHALVGAFEESPETAAVTGMIAPFELRTRAQIGFELIGGFGRGYRKGWYRVTGSRGGADVYHIGAGRFGAGANMAFRRSALRELGGFDPALDVGTATEGGGDLELFFRLLQEGMTLQYEPDALVWHRHRADGEGLARQIGTWGTAVGAYLLAAAMRYPHLRARLVRFGGWWLWFGYLGPFLSALTKPTRLPLDVRWRPLRTCLSGPWRYLQAGRLAAGRNPRAASPAAERRGPPAARQPSGTAVRICRLDLGVAALEDLAGHRDTLVAVELEGRMLGRVALSNRGRRIGAAELRATIAERLLAPLLGALLEDPADGAMPVAERELLRRLDPGDGGEPLPAPAALVSVVIATRGRGELLGRCLDSIAAQRTSFPFEVVVVDNDPGSPETRERVRGRDGVRYVAEPIEGLATARNAGIRASRGDIVAMTDDDVEAPPLWLEQLVEPFRARHVGMVTGNVLPLALETPAQRIFEGSGGLGKGDRCFEVGQEWLASGLLSPPRVWDLGASANAAFRRELFSDPAVGLMDESLGPGTPAGVGEDSYLLYRALLAGYGLFYAAHAVVFHRHRETLPALRRQMYAYSKGHVAYLLTTLVRHRDLRALPRLLFTLPLWHAWRLLRGPRKNPAFDRSVVLCESLGYLAGPVAWIRSVARARRLKAALLDGSRELAPLEP